MFGISLAGNVDMDKNGYPGKKEKLFIANTTDRLIFR